MYRQLRPLIGKQEGGKASEDCTVVACRIAVCVGYQLLKFPWLSTAFLTEVLPKSASWFLPKKAWEKEARTATFALASSYTRLPPRAVSKGFSCSSCMQPPR